jgi:hypothetical protein
MTALSFSVLIYTVCFGAAHAATMWSRTYGGTDWDSGYSVVQTEDGGYAIAGRTNSFGAGSADAWLVKTDADGITQWNQTYGGTNSEFGRSVAQTSDGGYAIAGYTGSFGAGSEDFWLVKTNATGNMQWNQTYGGTETDYGFSVAQTSDGGYAIAGFTGSYGAGGTDVWLVKTDADGIAQWNQTYGGTNSDYGYSMVKTSDGGYAISGSTLSYGAGSGDFFLVKTDAMGTMQWNETYGGTNVDEASSVVESSDGGYVMADGTLSFGPGPRAVWLVKTDEYGVVPEASWITLPLVLIATSAIFVLKKKLLHQRSKKE